MSYLDCSLNFHGRNFLLLGFLLVFYLKDNSQVVLAPTDIILDPDKLPNSILNSAYF